MSDEVFTPYDIRGTIKEGVSLEVAWNIGKALADWLPTFGVVAVANTEGAANQLVQSVIEGVRLQGRDVVPRQGDKTALVQLIQSAGYSGGIYLGYDEVSTRAIIELYGEAGQAITAENGLNDIAELVRGGNFVPAIDKGHLVE